MSEHDGGRVAAPPAGAGRAGVGVPAGVVAEHPVGSDVNGGIVIVIYVLIAAAALAGLVVGCGAGWALAQIVGVGR